MNKRQRLVQEAFLDNEEAVIKRLKQVYNQSLKDITKKAKELQDQINMLDAMEGMTSDPEELARLKSMKQAKVYQKQYQDALKKQVSGILDNMQVEEFKTVDEYLNKCYEEAWLGTLYDMHGQGIPLIMPMDQEGMVRAVQLDSKISQGLYTRLGEDVALLKKKITAQVSRGISTGMTFAQVAKQLEAYTNIGFNNAVRIARTEGHRIQVQSTMDTCQKAKEKGADVVKQWDASMDKRTRPSHARVDGEIRELDEKFSNGLMFPGDPAGGAAEVVNCRCALLQRARAALDEAELETLKERAAYFGLDKNDSFEDFKKKYLKAVEEGFMDDVSDGKLVNGKMSKRAKEIEKERDPVKQIKKIDSLVGDYVSTPSSWSGKAIKNDEMNVNGRFYRSTGDIHFRTSSGLKNKIHEVLHSRTVFDKKNRAVDFVNASINEGSVELLTQIICKDHGIPFRKSYEKQVDALKGICALLGKDERTFAIELFTTPFSERYNVLDKMVSDKMNSNTLSAMDEVSLVEIMDVLYGRKNERKVIHSKRSD